MTFSAWSMNARSTHRPCAAASLHRSCISLPSAWLWLASITSKNIGTWITAHEVGADWPDDLALRQPMERQPLVQVAGSLTLAQYTAPSPISVDKRRLPARRTVDGLTACWPASPHCSR